MYDVFVELVRRYQFRDREEICCHGLSVSQCYSLEALYLHGALTMGELAGHLYLELSTVTRIVDTLVAKNLAERITDARDRRVCRVRSTTKGRALVTAIRDQLVEEYAEVLGSVPPASREAVISALDLMLAAFTKRQDVADCKKSRKKRQKVV